MFVFCYTYSQVGDDDESGVERQGSDRDLDVGGLGIHSSSSGRCVAGGSSDLRVGKALTQVTTLPHALHTHIGETDSNNFKHHDS